MTGADVAASTDLTGSALLGGDWTLEASAGSIETTVPFAADVLTRWQGTLDVVTGDGNANYLTGTANADTISGLGGNDTLNGGGGNDTLDGSEGNGRGGLWATAGRLSLWNRYQRPGHRNRH